MAGFHYNGVTHIYRKDLQGNIIAVIDNTGSIVLKYEYNAWGKHTVTGNTALGNINPFRYRGYYYDTETGLYYLQSRYYDPTICRFINMDSVDYADPTVLGGLNLYAYCNNNPVMYVDPTGHELEWWHKLLIGIGFIVVGALVTAATAGTGTGFWAAFGSALLSSAIQVGASMAVGVGVNGIANVINGNGFFDNIGDTLADSFMWGGIFAGGSQIVSGGFRLLRAKTGFTGINIKSFGLTRRLY